MNAPPRTITELLLAMAALSKPRADERYEIGRASDLPTIDPPRSRRAVATPRRRPEVAQVRPSRRYPREGASASPLIEDQTS